RGGAGGGGTAVLRGGLVRRLVAVPVLRETPPLAHPRLGRVGAGRAGVRGDLRRLVAGGSGRHVRRRGRRDRGAPGAAVVAAAHARAGVHGVRPGDRGEPAPARVRFGLAAHGRAAPGAAAGAAERGEPRAARVQLGGAVPLAGRGGHRLLARRRRRAGPVGQGAAGVGRGRGVRRDRDDVLRLSGPQASSTSSIRSSDQRSSSPSGRRIARSGRRASTAPGSWVTMTIAPVKPSTASSTCWRLAGSRLFVGSSSSSTFAPEQTRLARAGRVFSPPGGTLSGL